MDDMMGFEERLASRLRADAARGAPALSSTTMAEQALRLAGRRSRFAPWIGPGASERRWILAGVTVALIILGLIAALLLGSHPPRTFPSNLIAYSDNATQAVWVKPRSGGSAQVVAGSSTLGPITWSPDGRWLAITTNDQRVLLVRPDGTESRVIGRGHDVRWSRDGRRLALIEPTPAGGQPAVHELASGRDTRLPIPAGFSSVQLVGWLGDDVHLLIRACAGCGTEDEHQYAWFTLPGEDRLALPSNAQPGSLSPDGWTMAWSPCASDVDISLCPGLFVSDLRTGSLRQIGDPSAIAYDPLSWGPDGTWIVYLAGAMTDAFTSNGVWRARLDGTAPVQLLDQPAESVVSPDGSEIAFVRIAEPLDRSLALLSADGSRTTELVPGSNVTWVAWQPSRPGARSPDDPAGDPRAVACDVRPTFDGRPEFGIDSCVAIQGRGAITPLDVDPEVEPVNVLDLNIDKRAGVGPGVLSGIHDTSVVALAAAKRCDADAFRESSAPGTGISNQGDEVRWCVRTKSGTVVELSLIGYDDDYGTYFLSQRRS